MDRNIYYEAEGEIAKEIIKIVGFESFMSLLCKLKNEHNTYVDLLNEYASFKLYEMR